MKWYKRDPDAAAAGMVSLTLEECGAYNLIIDAYYSRDGRLPDDDWLLSRILHCDPRIARRLKAALFSKQKLTVESDFLIPNRGVYTITEAQLRPKVGPKLGAKRREKANENNDASDTTTTRQKNTTYSSVGGAGRKRRAAIAPDWNPSPADLAYASGKGWSAERIAAEAERFAFHWRSSGEPKADWHATWCKWVTSPYQQPRRAAVQSLKERNREVLDGLDQFIARAVDDSARRRAAPAQGCLLLSDGKSA